jgi:hypothetical protein
MEALKTLSTDVENVPDMKNIVDTLTQIFEYMATDEMIKLKETNIMHYEQRIHDKFPDFCERYYALTSALLDGNLSSLDNLVDMIRTICLVKSGQITMDTAYTHVREELASKYIYPKFGSKQKFEQAIVERSKKHKK